MGRAARPAAAGPQERRPGVEALEDFGSGDDSLVEVVDAGEIDAASLEKQREAPIIRLVNA
jgi:hypothetical protein